MVEEYHLVLDGETRSGPYSAEDVLDLIGKGTVGASTPVWMKGFPNWIKVADLEQFRYCFSAEPPPFVPDQVSASVPPPPPMPPRPSTRPIGGRAQQVSATAPVPNPAPRVQPVNSSVAASEPKPAIPVDYKNYCVIGAAVLSFAWALITVLIALLQITMGSPGVGIWNILVGGFYVVLGIAMLGRSGWAYSWGIGSNALNLLLDVFYIATGGYLFCITVPVEIGIIALLLVSRDLFLRETKWEDI